MVLFQIAKSVGNTVLSWPQLNTFNVSSAKKLQFNRLPPQSSPHGSRTSVYLQQHIRIFCSF